MRAGRLNKRVELWFRSTQKNAFAEHSESFDIAGIRWAAVEPLNGQEYFSAVGQNSEVTTRFRFRFDNVLAALKTTDRLKYGDKFFDIKQIINPKERNRELIFFCSQNDRQS